MKNKLLKCLLVEVLILWGKKAFIPKEVFFSSVVHDKQVGRKQDAGGIEGHFFFRYAFLM